MQVSMLDLVGQQEALGAEFVDTLLSVVRTASYVSDGKPTSFERSLARYCKRQHAVGVASGTAALHLALLAAGIGPGDEVVTVPNSFFATTEAILLTGARPVFCDVEAETHLMDIEHAIALVTDKTKAVLPVHLYGQIVDINGLRSRLELAGRGAVLIIEDCAHAVGGQYCGTPVPLGDIGCFSFNPGKNIGGVSDAGAVVTDDDAIAAMVAGLRDHGRVEKNRHDVAGFNVRLSTLNARILDLKLARLDEWNGRRREIAERYDQAFNQTPHIRPIRPRLDTLPAYHQYVIALDDRDGLRNYLAQRGIASAIHYPTLIPDQKPVRGLGVEGLSIPVARGLSPKIVSLPCHPQLTDSQADVVIEAVTTFCRESQVIAEAM
ncbi:DegT/DnrJ/EryC1/StrS family aminotransferase [Bradyrhizobium sp. HKCCYLS1011]|uniref:DegT/DnrJ/EryC1/StrS family aminotransferase n=1 Tax=Bradyrhizobium sp. HKCCYLS1011 TaxID=3420733 RepID=UPI003EC03966